MTKKKKIIKLKNELIFIPSSDKTFIEKWYKGRNILNFPGFIMCIYGKPGCGKTQYIKNVLIRAKPRYQRVFVLHADPKAKEYNDIDAEILTELPPNDFWRGYCGLEGDDRDDDLDDIEEKRKPPKTLLIMDDVCFPEIIKNKEQSARFDRLCGNIHSHYNVNVAILNQDPFSIPPIARKTANVHVIFKPSDTDELNTISRRVGLQSKTLKRLFETLAKEEHQSITVDHTRGTPYPLRLDGFKIIKLK